jgi:hypothetical protein
MSRMAQHAVCCTTIICNSCLHFVVSRPRLPTSPAVCARRCPG